MEALAGLSVAANIAQFIAFASAIVSTSVEAFQNHEGCVDDVSSIAATYDKLRDLSHSLGTSIADHESFVKHPEIVNIFRNLEELSRACKDDCDKLSKVVETLQSKGKPPNGWRSFRSALKTMWKAKEINAMELRLKRSQTTLTLHVSVLTRLQLDEMRQECLNLNTQQDGKLELIAQMIADLGQFVRAKQPEVAQIKKPIQTADLEDLQSRVSRLSLASAEISKGNSILNSLIFKRQTARHMSIPAAHAKTLEWVLDDNANAQFGPTASNLLKWLRTGQRWFWVSGKPGSGKSTLMKYLSGHKATFQALHLWSPDVPVIVGRHFFWSAGSLMQKSRQGLLQNLLYEIFSQVPDLMPLVCGQRWTDPTDRKENLPWNGSEMDSIFLRIATMKHLPVRFCFFIDGLDEYEGDHVDICQSLCNLSESQYIKLCISSRPWNVFEDALGHDESLKLYVHEFTREDIQRYSEEQLQAHPRWKAMKNQRQDIDRLSTEITDRAKGVFLWVYLVVRELREGLSEYDSFSDLFRRVESIPTDLEVFFKQILDSVPKSYYGKMTTTLQIACKAPEPLDALFYDFSDMEHDDLAYAENMVMCFQSDQDLASRRDTFSRRLKARTKGLLEVHYVTGKVEFLHRTVLDFLNTADMSKYLGRRMPPRFDFGRTILKAIVAWIKTVTPSVTTWDIITLAAFYTTDVEADVTAFTVIGIFEKCLDAAILHAALLRRLMLPDNTSSVYTIGPKRRYKHPPQIGDTMRKLSLDWTGDENPVTLFRASLLRKAASEYIDYALDHDINYFSLLPTSPMSYILNLDSLLMNKAHQKTLECLLRHNEDPNEEVGENHETLWKQTLNRCVTDQDLLRWSLETGFLCTMIRFGADPYVAWKNILLAFFSIPTSGNYGMFYLKVMDEVCTKIESLESSHPEICDWIELKFPQLVDLQPFLDTLWRLSTDDPDLQETRQTQFQLLERILVQLLVNVDEASQEQIVSDHIERRLGRKTADSLRRRLGLIHDGDTLRTKRLSAQCPSPLSLVPRKRGNHEIDFDDSSSERKHNKKTS